MTTKVLKSQPGTNVQNTLINGVRINKRFMSTITNPKMWLTSNNINVYMHLLSQDRTKNVHIVEGSDLVIAYLTITQKTLNCC